MLQTYLIAVFSYYMVVALLYWPFGATDGREMSSLSQPWLAMVFIAIAYILTIRERRRRRCDAN